MNFLAVAPEARIAHMVAGAVARTRHGRCAPGSQDPTLASFGHDRGG